MSEDIKPPAQIIDLFEAMKGSLYDMSRSPNARSAGDVEAPLIENECCKCRTKLMRRTKSDSYVCDECWETLFNEGERRSL